jgi:DNA-directed RNA polymerase subunit N (RpoN/RPB10)
MDSYQEYPVRCKGCNNPIASRIADYTALLEQGHGKEAALNLLDLPLWCCRIAVMNPVIVTFNMEVREAIDGTVDVGLVTPEMLRGGSTRPPSPTPRPTGVGIPLPVGVTATTELIPEAVGTPVINPDPTLLPPMIPVGERWKCVVLNGRTYLCR